MRIEVFGARPVELTVAKVEDERALAMVLEALHIHAARRGEKIGRHRGWELGWRHGVQAKGG